MTLLGWIPYLAGSSIAFASVPRVLERIRGYRSGCAQFGPGDLWRDSLIAIGNGLWVVFGVADNHAAITVFCGIQVPLMGTLVLLNLYARRL